MTVVNNIIELSVMPHERVLFKAIYMLSDRVTPVAPILNPGNYES
jgi:hypothetical protein